MDSRERNLVGAKGFDWSWWIFEVSVSVLPLRDIRSPEWLAMLLCMLDKHAWWIDSELFKTPTSYRCLKCGKKKTIG